MANYTFVYKQLATKDGAHITFLVEAKSIVDAMDALKLETANIPGGDIEIMSVKISPTSKSVTDNN